MSKRNKDQKIIRQKPPKQKTTNRMNKDWEKEQQRKKEKIDEKLRKDLKKQRDYNKKLDDNSLDGLPGIKAKGSTLKTLRYNNYFEDYQFSKKTHIYSKYPIKSVSGVLVITFEFYKKGMAYRGGTTKEDSIGLSKKHRFPRDYETAFRECLNMGSAKIAFSPDGYKVKSELYSYWISNKNAIFQ